jgi:hypothetical protein
LVITLAKGISYHSEDLNLGRQFGLFRLADLIELGGIAIALIAVLRQNVSNNDHQSY